MNQIILIGEVKAIIEDTNGAYITIETKDYNKSNVKLEVFVELGYKQEMLEALNAKPLIAVKCGLKINKTKIEFVAEKMSILKLTEEDPKELGKRKTLKSKKSK
jgi:hypothetical protein